MLLLSVGESRYAIDTMHVLRVIPHVNLLPDKQAPEYIAGVLFLDGKQIRVVDLCQLVEKRPAVCSFLTRIIVVKPFIAQSQPLRLGILAEGVSDVIELLPGQFRSPGLSQTHFPYFDAVCHDSQGIIQRIDTEELFSWLTDDLCILGDSE